MSNPKYGIGYEDGNGKITLSRATYETLPEAEKQAEALEANSGGMWYEVYQLVKIPRRREKKDGEQAWGEMKVRGAGGIL